MPRVIFYMGNQLTSKLKKTFTIISMIAITVLSLISAINPTKLYVNADTNAALTITGLVDHPLNLTLNDLTAMPQTAVYASIICVDSPGQVLEQGNWVGVKISTLLENAGISNDAVKIGFFASDGYSTDLNIPTAMRNDVILAYQKDNQALNDLRLVVPGKWGYKWINQVTSISVLNYDYLGHWESQGYSDDADIASSAHMPTQIQQNSTSPKTTAPPVLPTPTTQPTPDPSQQPPSSAPNQQAVSTPQTSNYNFLQTNSIYIVTAAVLTAIAIMTVVVRKRKTGSK
jgi:hypothetical protein